MYKKIIIALLLISPLFFLFVGYPVNTGIKQVYNSAALSRRCFDIGNTNQFIACFKSHPRTNFSGLIKGIVTDTNALQPNMGYFLLLFFIGQIAVLISIVKTKNI